MDDAVPMRRCGRCDTDKPATLEFYPKRSERPGGLGWWCRACCREVERQRYDVNSALSVIPPADQRIMRIRPDGPPCHNCGNPTNAAGFCQSCGVMNTVRRKAA